MTDPTTRTAADLGVALLDHLAAGRVDDLAALFAEDGVWELAYRLTGMTDEQLLVRGRRVIGKFHTVMNRTVDSVTFTDVRASAVSGDLAFLEFRSAVVTADGDAYGNRYVARVEASDGELTRWLEYFDPRPAELIRRNFAASVRKS